MVICALAGPSAVQAAEHVRSASPRIRPVNGVFMIFMDQCVEGLDELAGLQLPLKEGSRHVEPSERVMHSMTTRSDGTAVAETVAVGAERVYPSNVFS